MPYFVDTSALFKRYQSEKGTALVCRVLEATDQPAFISSITILDLTADDIIKAEDLILKRYMKPVDSIQLAIKPATCSLP
jgi:hypothetical protein